MIEDLLSATIRVATPLIIVAMGSIICERVGVLNVATEGFMIFGAFFGIFGVYATQSPILGAILGIVVCGFVSLVFIFLIEYFHTEPIITALGFNTFATGLTALLMNIFFSEQGAMSSERITGFPRINILLFKNNIALNTIFNNHTILTFVAPLLVIVFHFILYKTHLGIKMRAVGENPMSATVAGISTKKYHILGVLASGFLGGLAGVHISLGYVNLFTKGMIAGRGFMAFAAVIFGKGDPLSVLAVCIVYALAESIAIRSQNFGVPSPLVSMLPYILTILALFVRKDMLTNSINSIKGLMKKKAQDN